MSRDTHPPASPAAEGEVTIQNRLPPGHRYRATVDEAVRAALSDVPGPWEVSAHSVGRAWFRVAIVAPDGASWSLSVPVHEGPRAEDLAATIRAACIRHSRRRAGAPAPETPGGSSR
jgi:hypothetical protein